MQDGDEIVPGDEFGHYRIEARLGAGGMGIVFEATDPRLDRRVALKVVRPKLSEARATARILREGQALARLAHPNVVPIFDVGVDDSKGRVFIAMELVEGSTLDAWLAAQKRDWTEVVEVFRQCARGLSAAHAEGLVHRDFKPSNVMVGTDGRARVLDFGVAHVGAPTPSSGVASGPESSYDPAPHSGESLTATGTVVGTPAYMAPEQHRRAALDARTDQFAWSAAFYEALFSVRPFVAKNLVGLYRAKCARDIQPPAPDASAPRWLVPILARGLEPNPVDRWSDMGELLAAIAHRRARARRWTLGAGLLGSLGGIAALAVGATASADAVDCESVATAELAEVWNDETREALSSALPESSSSYADAARRRAARRLGEYASQWAAMREQVCHRARQDAEDPLLDRRLACLADRRARIGGVVESLPAADSEEQEAGVAFVDKLPALEDCENEDVLGVSVPPPGDSAVVAEVHRIRTALTWLEHSGSLEDGGLELFDAVVEDARATGYAPIVAEALFGRALMLRQSPDAQRAADAFEEAYDTAIEADYDELAARAASQLGHVITQQQSRLDDGVRWAETAVALADRLEGSQVRAATRNTAAAAYTSSGDHERAEALYREVIALCEANGRSHDLILVAALGNFGADLDDLGRYAEAEVLLRRAVKLSREIYGESYPKTGYFLGNLGNALVHQGKRDEAEPVLRESVEILEAALGPEHPWVAMALGNLANIYFGRDSARYEELSRRVLKILEASLGPTHPALATAKDNVAGALMERGELEEALTLRRDALGIRREVFGNEHLAVAESLEGLAVTMFAAGRVDEGIARYEEALAINAAVVGDEHPSLVDRRTRYGTNLLVEGRSAEAVATLQKAVAACESPGAEAGVCAMARSELTRARAAADAAPTEPAGD